MNEVIKSLLPPEDSPVKRWRQAIAATVIMLVLAVAAGFGMFSWLGFGGFARASDLEERVNKVTADVAGVKQGVDEIKIQLLEQSVFDAKERECSSTDAAARQFFSKRVLSLSREYQLLAAASIIIPPCRN